MWEWPCYVCVALFVLSLFISFMISPRSTWEKLKEKLVTHFSFIAIMLGCSLYLIIVFINGSSIFWLTGSPSVYCGIPRLVVMFEKKSLRTVAVFLSFSTMLSFSTRVVFSLETTLFDNTGLTTPQHFLLSHNFYLLRLP